MFKWLKTKEVRNRVFFTLLIVLLFQIGTTIPLPYLTKTTQESSTLSGLLNLTSGGALGRFGLLALGISPYITAQIIMSLLEKVIPSWHMLSKQDSGRSKLGQYTKYITMVFALVQGYGIIYNPFLSQQFGLVVSESTKERLIIIFLMMVGALFTHWLGTQIDENGVGQGASVLIAFGILSTLPAQIKHIIDLFPIFKEMGQVNEYWKQVGIMGAIFLFMLIVIIILNNKEYRYQIQSATNQYEVKAHYFPIKLLVSSVMPVIFATAFLTLLTVLNTMFAYGWDFLDYTKPKGLILYVSLIFLFSFIYNFIQIDADEIEENFKESGIYFLGVNLNQTAKFVNRKLLKITLIGDPALTFIATLAIAIEMFAPQQFNLSLTGVSLLIVVGVLQEMAHQIKGLTSKHNYKEIF